MKITLDSTLTTVLVACALITTGLFVRRELSESPRASQLGIPDKPIFIEDWQRRLQSGLIRTGSPDAPVQLIEFIDYECPSCAEFHKTVRALRARHPAEVAVSYVHYPLDMHRFAPFAAQAAECAAAHDRFETMHDELFAGQRDFGLKPWREFARAAGVTDLDAFDTCVSIAGHAPRIEAGKQLAAALDIRGTPTLIVNGRRLPNPPGLAQMEKIIEAVRSGKDWPASL
jgi:protein-disulfide isomerase